ncbi:MAG: TIGR04551 family protein [Myxococcales bacterium]|nr:TIGR04551 family protein [Myxococcales bacterium]
MRRLLAAALVLVALPARATGFTDVGDDLHPRDKTEVELHGAFRVRGELLNNLDLDRGTTPSGELLYPVPGADPKAQSLYGGDLRLRTDLAFYSLGGNVAVKMRVDVLDDVAMGGAAVGAPSASSTQRSPPGDVFRVKRAYGEVRTPVGVLAAGRMGAHFGLGMLANGGDCADCDSGDAQDRIAFITPLAGHIWAAAYDMSWVGPTAWRKDGVRRVGIAPATQVHSVTFAMLRWHDPSAIVRRTKAGKATLDYGATVAHRWQASDAPYEWLPLASSVGPVGSPITSRGFSATVLDAWLRFISPMVRIELEAAVITTTVDQPSLVPGVSANRPVTGRQIGAALETDFGPASASAGLDLGYASGDPAPGFGAYPSAGAAAPRAGDLDGAQADLARDRRVDNFRFHSDYRIDRLLFREIIGTVTDAVYFRPHVRVDLYRAPTATLRFGTAGIVSFANEPASTPGGRRPLGVEIDPTLSYESRDGFGAALEYAVLFPLSGFDNPAQKLSAKPAQLVRVRLVYAF